MYIQLEPLFKNIGHTVHVEYTMDLSEESFYSGHPFDKDVVISGEVKNRAGIVSIEAEAKVEIDTQCDRCACPVNRVFTVPISHTFVTSLNNEDNDELILVENMKFDLDPLVREDIFLTLPQKILCKENCKGLCQYCGKNLNEGPCNCKKPIDPRLEVLKQLLDD